MTEHYGTEHHVFGQDVGLRFDHQNGVGGSRDDQIELRFLQRFAGRVQQVLAVLVADAGGTDRALERHARQAQGSRCTEHGGNVGIDFRVQ